MTELDLNGLLANPTARRLWLLCNALRHLPFDQAIERASAAEAFVTESTSEEPPVELKGDSEPALAPQLGKTEIDIGVISQATHNVVPRLSKRPPLSLPDEQRDRLLQRFAEGAKNAELVRNSGYLYGRSRASGWARRARSPSGASSSAKQLQAEMRPHRAPPQPMRSFDIYGSRTTSWCRARTVNFWSTAGSTCH